MHQPTGSTPSENNLKLEAQKVKDFTGNFSEWQKWKSRTECAFNGSGFGKILNDEEFAEENERMNSIVYSQLAAATVDGNAHHLVKEYEDGQDGYAAWQNLCDWYDGDVVKHETADELRSKLESLKLDTTTAATQYINKFLTWHSDIAKIPGEELSPSHGVYLFLKNISDPEYEATVRFCRNQNSDLKDCVSAIRKAERDLIRKRAEKRKLDQYIRRLVQENQDNKKESKKRKSESDDNHPMTIKTDDKGYFHFRRAEWIELTKQEKMFVKNWNKAIRNGNSTKDLKPPDGFTFDDNRRYTFELVDDDSSKKRRVSTSELVDTDTDTDTDDDIEL